MAASIDAHGSLDATPADHLAEAGRLLDDVWLMVYQSRHGWGSAEAAAMLQAADIHARLADLKSRLT
ncbi:hypothetical protein [Streptomonospora nanhaiensis]|uniref:hypothetical protein n=1 Tax=Streptomonospora nanhaiensis TaxID=1323731 RepID=UPI001C38A308|nr:hypothetical protein [Streptomonospora nanhaiensis]MBV2364227.1 hypothetical protein [Streptomonospora nanhaiensis]